MIKADDLIGQVIGGYRISFELPSSSQNTPLTYLAESETEPGKQVLLKFVSSHPLTSPVDQQSFLHEAQMFQRLEHPHIVPLLNYGIIHGLPYIMTPYLSWRPLSTHIRRHWSAPFALPETLQLLSQLGEALHYAHQQHLFHGQLTPRCVLLDDRHRPLLTDFRFTSLATGSASAHASYPESVYYLAPEQRLSQHRKESDQYALACIAYELLTGRRPAPAATTTEEADVEPLVAPSALNPAVQVALDKAILKALSVDLEQRFGSLHQFLEALSQPSEASAAVSSRAQAQSAQEMQQAPVQNVVAPPPFSFEPQSAQADAHLPSNAGLQKVAQDRPIDQVQLPFPALPTYAQQPDSPQPWSFQPVAAQFQSRTPEPISSPIAPPPPVMSSPFAPAPPVAPASFSSILPPITQVPFSMPWRPGRTRLSRMAQILVIVVALFVVLGSSIVLVAAFARTNHATATASHATTRSTTKGQATQTDVLPQSNPMATATVQAQSIATALAQGKPQLLWTFTTGGQVYSSPNVVNGVVYVGSSDSKLYAINTVTGQQAWAFTTRGKIHSLPAVANGIVYTGSADSGLYAVDAATGQQKWVFGTGSGVSASPAVVNGIVYISSGDGKLFAIDAATGQQKWVFTARAAFWRSLIVVNGVVYAGSIDHNLYAVDATSGQEKWAFKTAGYITAPPTVANSVVYVGSEDHKLYAIDAATGLQKWAFVTGSEIWSSPTVVNGVVYVGSHDHKLYAIDAATGQQKWALTTGDKVWSSPTVVNGVVFVGSMDDKVYAINAATGQQVWAFPTGSAIQYSSPTVVNGVLYIGSNDHKVYAIVAGTPASRSAAIASAGAEQLYSVVTSVNPTWSDPLSAQDTNNWTVSENCAFSGGAYHITSSITNTVESCYANTTNFCNLAFQVQITDISGEGGGIHFRADAKNKTYNFTIKHQGAYDLLASGVSVIPYTLTSSPAFHRGYNVSNVITVIALGSKLYFYVNQQFLVSANDSSLTCGKIGLYVYDVNSHASSSFSNVKVWKL